MSKDWNPPANQPPVWANQQYPADSYQAENISTKNQFGNPGQYYDYPSVTQQSQQNPFYAGGPSMKNLESGQGNHLDVGYRRDSNPPNLTSYPVGFGNPTNNANDLFSEQNASMILKAVNTLNNSMGGLDPMLLKALAQQTNSDNRDQHYSKQPEIYSPTFNSPPPSPDKLSNASQSKTINSSRPFYEQYNAYDTGDNDMSSKVDKFLHQTNVSRQNQGSNRDRTWAGSVSPRSQFGDTNRNEFDREYEANVRRRRNRSKSPMEISNRQGRSRRRGDGPRRNRSSSRKNRSKGDENCKSKERVLELLMLTKEENRKFVQTQTPSNVLLVMNLEHWITDKVLWGAIHSYARKYQTTAPFYVEKATFNFKKSDETNLGLMAFPTVEATEACMKVANYELLVVGRKKKSYKMMYYSEKSLLFDVLNHKFTLLWKAVQSRRMTEGMETSDIKNSEDYEEKKLDRKSRRSRSKEEKSNDQSLEQKEVIQNSTIDENKEKEENVLKKIEVTKVCKAEPEDTLSDIQEETPPFDESTKKVAKKEKKPQPPSNVNIIKTNIIIGKMKSYLIKQIKSKPNSEEENYSAATKTESEKKSEASIINSIKSENHNVSKDTKQITASTKNGNNCEKAVEKYPIKLEQNADSKEGNMVGKYKDTHERAKSVAADDIDIFKNTDENNSSKMDKKADIKDKDREKTAVKYKEEGKKENSDDKETEQSERTKRKLSPNCHDIYGLKHRNYEENSSIRSRSRDRYQRSRSRERYRRNRSRSREMHSRHRESRKRDFEEDDHDNRNSYSYRDRRRRDYPRDDRQSDYRDRNYHKRERTSKVDDIDGNEDDYWNSHESKENSKVPLNPWAQNQSIPSENTSLSVNELKDPEFLLRVLLQTSIMIQNNQLTMVDPLEVLSENDKDLINQTLNELDHVPQDVIQANLNDKTKFNGAENRVLVEALSNLSNFKKALLPASSSNTQEENMEIDDDDEPPAEKPETNVYVSMNHIKPHIKKEQIIKYLNDFNLNFEFVKIHRPEPNEFYTTGVIKFQNIKAASQLLTRTNKLLYLGNDREGIRLSISNLTSWTCNKCLFRNKIATFICMRCEKLKEKLRDVQLCGEITNKIIMINFKSSTSVQDISQALNKIAPQVQITDVTLHVDSSNDQVCHFIVTLENKQASALLKKCIMENMKEFSWIQAGCKIALNFLVVNTPVSDVPAYSVKDKPKKVYTFVDIPRLAEYSATLYAKTEQERLHYYQHYSTLYTQELVKGNQINVVLPEDAVSESQAPVIPSGTDNRSWPRPNISSFSYDANSGYYYDVTTGLYYESSSQYFYNMETGKFLQYDPTRSTYVLVQNSEITSAPTKTSQDSTTNNTEQSLEKPGVSKSEESSTPKFNPPCKESKTQAKLVMKNMEKWAKAVQKMDKKKAPPSSMLTNDTERKATPADVCFDLIRRTDTNTKSSVPSSVPPISSLILENVSLCEEEEEEQRFIDWKNFTCNLCHRVFNNADILSKHSLLSELHLNNLKQWYISKNLDPNNEEIRKRQYRDRVLERNQKNQKKVQPGSSSPPESWLCSTPMCMAYKRSGFDTCITCDRNAESYKRSKPYSDRDHKSESSSSSVGSQLLKKMGWQEGTGLGKRRQGNQNLISTNMKSDYLGLGAQTKTEREEGESYVDFMRRNTQKRFQEASQRY